MLSEAHRLAPSILRRIVSRTFLVTVASVAALYLPKAVLSEVENGESVSRLILTIAFYTAVLTISKTADSYISNITEFILIEPRTNMILQNVKTMLRTDYDNTENPDFRLRFQISLDTPPHTDNCFAK